MLNLNSTIDIDFKTFLRWWKRELSFLIPERLKRLINDKQGFIIITPKAGQLHLTYIDDGGPMDLLVLDRNDTAPAQFQNLTGQDEKFSKANVVLRLSGSDALIKELWLPAAAKENLKQVVTYELDRYTPFKAEQVYFAVRMLENRPESGQIKVLLVLAPRDLLDSICEDLTALGVSPIFADCEKAPNSLDYYRDGYDLMPERYRKKTARTPGLIYSGLIVSAILLFIAALVLPVWFQYQTVQALAEKVQRIEKEAKKIKLLQAEVDAVIKETQELLDEKMSTPAIVVILNSLSTIIKDETSLAYLQYSDGHLQIQGESPAASTLIGVLEDSELFNNARFVSPVTQDNISKLERFQITVDVTKKGGSNGNAE